jgi:hypothetical protein
VSVSQQVNSEVMAAGSLTAPGGRLSQLVVFGVNKKTWNTTYTKYISTGGVMRADELCSSPHVVLIANDEPQDNFVTFFDVNTYANLGTISLNNIALPSGTTSSVGIEQCQYNPRDGKFYLNLPDSTNTGGHVLRISSSAPFTIEADFNTSDIVTCKPAGLAVGPVDQLALGCGARTCSPTPCTPPPGNSLIISDGTGTRSGGSTISFVTDQAGADEIWYDYGSNHYYFARSTIPGTTPVVGALGVEDAGDATTAPAPDPDATGTCQGPTSTVTPGGCIVTASGSHSVAADSILGLVFVPISNSAAAQAGTVCSGGLDAFHVPGRDNLGCVAVYQSSEPTPEPGALLAPASPTSPGPRGGKKH